MHKEIDYLIKRYKSELSKAGENWPVNVQKAAQYIHRHLFDPDMTIASIYERNNITDKNFAGKFNAYFGLTPKKYVLHHRIECSKQILEQVGRNDLPLIMLAMKLGFSTHAAFTRAFKSRTGMTPGQWIQEKN